MTLKVVILVSPLGCNPLSRENTRVEERKKRKRERERKRERRKKKR